MKMLIELILATVVITLAIELLTIAAIWSVGRREEERIHEW